MYRAARRNRRAFAVLTAVALVAAACGDDDDGDDDEPEAPATEADTDGTDPSDDGDDPAGGDDEPEAAAGDGEHCTTDRSGGELVVLNGFPSSGLDSTLLFGTGAYGGDMASAFYGNLIRYDPDADTYDPMIAESWEPNEDNSVWTIRLRDDVTFGNGDPFTTEHVAAHIERMQGSFVRAAGMAQLVTDVEIVDDFEMIVSMSSPFNVPYMLATEVGWVPNNNVVEERGEEFHVNPAGAGAGAFEFESVSVTPGESLVLTAKDDWWGGAVCIGSIEFQYVPGEAAKLDAFLNRDADIMFVDHVDQAHETREADLLRYEALSGQIGHVIPDQGVTGRDETPFTDVRVREAMQLAIDYEVIHERLYDGVYPAPTSALVPEDSPLWGGVEGPPTDPERAAELVQETIDEEVWDGSFTYTHGTAPEQAEAAVLLQGMWEAVGMDVTLNPVPDVATVVIAERDFEVAPLGFGILQPAPWSTLNGLRSDSVRSRSGFADPDVDAAIDRLQEAITVEEAREGMAELQEAWNRTFPLIGLWHSVYGSAAHPHVQGLEFGADWTVYLDRAWVDQ